jgi:serine phosphatase RsbU (regulator of sigma subunit)
MQGLFDAAAYRASLLSLPYALVTGGLLLIVVLVLVTRAHPLLRAGLGGAAGSAVPWALASTLAGSAQDPVLAARLYRLGLGSISLVGPSLLVLLLALAGVAHRHRRLIAIAVLCAAASSVMTWSTHLVVRDAWRTSWGLYYLHGGPLNDLHVANLVVWPLLGLLLVRQRRSRRMQEHYQRVGATAFLVLCGAGDALLAHGIGVYPLSWLPGFIVIGVAVHGVVARDLLHSEGLDSTTPITAAIIVALAIALALVPGSSLGVEVGAAVGLMAISQVGLTVLRGRTRVVEDPALAADRRELARGFAATSSRTKVLARLEELLTDRLGFDQLHLYVSQGDQLVELVHGRALVVDPRVRVWLRAHRVPLFDDRLDAQQLGGLRGEIEAFLASCGGALVVPLVDRDALIGLVVTGERRSGRSLTAGEHALLRHAQEHAARALARLGLYHEALSRVAVAREVEVAATVRRVHPLGERRVSFPGCELTSFHLAEGSFGGQLLRTHALPSGRLLVVVGELTGQGVAVALLARAVAGFYDVAARREVGLGELVGPLHELVRATGHGKYTLSCFLALIDPAKREIDYLGAGLPFPYLLGRGGRVSVLVSRGTPLGGDDAPVLAPGRCSLTTGDVLVMHGAALTAARDRAGAPYGERRLLRLLRALADQADGDLCRAIVADLSRHRRGRRLDEDVLLAQVRLT